MRYSDEFKRVFKQYSEEFFNKKKDKITLPEFNAVYALISPAIFYSPDKKKNSFRDIVTDIHTYLKPGIEAHIGNFRKTLEDVIGYAKNVLGANPYKLAEENLKQHDKDVFKAFEEVTGRKVFSRNVKHKHTFSGVAATSGFFALIGKLYRKKIPGHVFVPVYYGQDSLSYDSMLLHELSHASDMYVCL